MLVCDFGVGIELHTLLANAHVKRLSQRGWVHLQQLVSILGVIICFQHLYSNNKCACAGRLMGDSRGVARLSCLLGSSVTFNSDAHWCAGVFVAEAESFAAMKIGQRKHNSGT